MEIILLERIENIGSIGDKVKVKPGYARNFLIPQGKATFATPENIAKFEAMRAELESKAAEELAAAQARAKTLEGLTLRIEVQAGPEGRLFGSVGTPDIAAACAEQGIEIERSEVRMADGPLRSVGEHTVDFHLHTDVNVSVKVFLDGGDVVTAIEDIDADDAPEADADDEDTQA
ncbi:MAG TPA: 50S ribosomal protein L9 [Gammaproteobacteria bacterium]|nr:50S ribosomal protein L9 [Gammaproteobacteria bacterium]